MTNQEIFDKVVDMLAARDFARAGAYVPVINNDDVETGTRFSCMYRSPIGPCAIGLFIPDELYVPEMEGKTAGRLFNEFDIPELADTPLGFLSELQQAHDQAVSAEHMKRALRSMACMFGLSLPEALLC